MKDGFIRVAAATPDIKVADPVYNEAQVWNMIEGGEKRGKAHGVPGALPDGLYLRRPVPPGYPGGYGGGHAEKADPQE